jgi:predicted Zn-dependent protease
LRIRQGRTDAAEAELARAHSLAPGSPRLALAYAASLSARGAVQRARQVIARALRARSEDAALQSALAGYERELRARPQRTRAGLNASQAAPGRFAAGRANRSSRSSPRSAPR